MNVSYFSYVNFKYLLNDALTKIQISSKENDICILIKEKEFLGLLYLHLFSSKYSMKNGVYLWNLCLDINDLLPASHSLTIHLSRNTYVTSMCLMRIHFRK